MILDLPQRLIGLVFDEESQVRQQLPEPDFRRELLDVNKLLDDLMLNCRGHGLKSPTFGSPA